MPKIPINGPLSLSQNIPNVDGRFGPYTSVAEANEYLGPAVNPTDEYDDVISAGMLFGIYEDDGSVTICMWTKDHATVNDFKRISHAQVVQFNGIVTGIVSINQSSGATAKTASDIKYLEQNKKFGYLQGSGYIVNWVNRYIWADASQNPYQDVLYLNIATNALYYYTGTALVALTAGSQGSLVTSVNGQTGAVTITIPTKLSDLTNDVGFITNAGVTSFNGQTGAVTYTPPVTSVNNKTGAVVLSPSDIGLGNVDNTPDANKQVYSAVHDGSGNPINETYETKTHATAQHSLLQSNIDSLANVAANLTGLEGTNFGGFSLAADAATAVSNIPTVFTQNGCTVGQPYWFLAGADMSALVAYRYIGSGTPAAISATEYDFTDFTALSEKVKDFKGTITTLSTIDSLYNVADVGIYHVKVSQFSGLLIVEKFNDGLNTTITQQLIASGTPVNQGGSYTIESGQTLARRAYSGSAWTSWTDPIAELQANVAALGPEIGDVVNHKIEGYIHTESHITHNDSGNYYVVRKRVIAGKKYCLYVPQNCSPNRDYLFTSDKDGNTAIGTRQQYIVGSNILIAPTGANYLWANVYFNAQGDWNLYSIIENDERITELQNTTLELNQEVEKVKGMAEMAPMNANLLDISGMLANKYIQNSSGEIGDTNNYNLTPFIDVRNVSQIYLINSSNFTVMSGPFFLAYDENKNPIPASYSGSNSPSMPITIQPEWKYIRISIGVGFSSPMVSESHLREYVAFEGNEILVKDKTFTLAKNNKENIDIVSNYLFGKPVYDYNGFVNSADGVLREYAGAKATSTYYPIDPNGAFDYKVSGYGRWSAAVFAFYDKNKAFISAYQQDSAFVNMKVSDLTTIPANARYIRFSSLDASTTPYGASVLHPDSKSEKWLGLKWTVLGDSLTEHNRRALKNYHDYIAEQTGIYVQNLGQSGSGYANGTGSGTKQFYKRVSEIAEDVNVITIFGSFNDLGVLPLGNVTDSDTSTICGCMNKAIDDIRAAFPLVNLGVITPTAWVGNVPTESENTNCEQYVAAILKICRLHSVPCLDLFHCSNLLPSLASFRAIAYKRDGTYSASTEGTPNAIQVTEDLLGYVTTNGVSEAQVGDWVLMSGGGVHPDEEGHKLIASRFKNFLESLLLTN